VLGEFALAPGQFVMIGNSLRSDIAPVLHLGGWGVHMPYHTTWIHEATSTVAAADAQRMCSVADAAGLPDAVHTLAQRASRQRIAD
jgi:putative hydrolase of the HAD superfamily